MKNKSIIVTGSSGFIGYHVCKKFLRNGYSVYGIDNHNNYYNPKIKLLRLNKLKKNKNFKFYRLNIKDKKKLDKVLKITKPKIIIHLAAQAGVRYSFINPRQYVDTNITGFTNILEIMKKYKLKNLVYASSSSVYGDCKKFPFKENLDLNPLNFYGQTKLMNEKIANLYEKNFKIKTIGLRFFTVYGPYGRPDMFIPKILSKLKRNETLDLYNNGNHYRDFTYVEDVSEIIFTIIKKFKKKLNNNIFNICNSRKINIKKVIKIIENITNKKIKYKNHPFQIGDMMKTHGSNLLLKKNFKIKKFKNFDYGIKKTINVDFFNES